MGRAVAAMRHRLDCPQCWERYPSKRIMSAFVLWKLECPACGAPLRFTNRSSLLLGLVAGVGAAAGMILVFVLWPSLAWGALLAALVATHYLSGLLWITCGELEIDRNRRVKPQSP